MPISGTPHSSSATDNLPLSSLNAMKQLMLTFLISSMLLACSSPQKKESSPVEATLEEIRPDQIDSLIASYEGERAVLVNIWATWCGPCVEEFPHIVDLQQKYPEQLRVIFISTDFPGDEDRVKDFLREQDVDWTTYIKRGNDQAFIAAVSPDWSGAQPFTKIVSPSGEVVASWENSRDFDTFERHVKQALNP